jgi:hypothetical protein
LLSGSAHREPELGCALRLNSWPEEEKIMSSETDEIIALEKSYWDAMKAKDGERTAALSGKTSLVSGQRGVMSIDKDKMGAMTEEGEWTLESYGFEDVLVTRPTSDVAIIAYKVRQKVTMKGEPKEFQAADCSTWIRGHNGWECHAHSETILTKH